jgi:hypothetical protein
LLPRLAQLVADDSLRARLGIQSMAHAKQYLDYGRLGPAMTALYQDLVGASGLAGHDEGVNGGPSGKASRPV